eukprot:2888622-Prymnesium_polylepis.2
MEQLEADARSGVADRKDSAGLPNDAAGGPRAHEHGALRGGTRALQLRGTRSVVRAHEGGTMGRPRRGARRAAQGPFLGLLHLDTLPGRALVLLAWLN